MIDYEILRGEAAHHPYPLLFATISGAHLYGFPSPDSDFDLRGAHILPLESVVGLLDREETVEVEGMRGELELDLVTHDIAKFFAMMLKRNGYVLEQLFSPLVVETNSWHSELKEIAGRCLTRYHSHHYLGFAATQRELFLKGNPPRVKPLLYVYRVLLTGIYLMRTGVVEANLITLNEEFRLPFIGDLVARKLQGPELSTLDNPEVEFHKSEYEMLVAQLAQASQQSMLPEVPTGKAALNDLLVRIRLGR